MRILAVDTTEEDLTVLHSQLRGHADTLIPTTERALAAACSAAEPEVDVVAIARKEWRATDTDLCARVSAARATWPGRAGEVPILALSGPCEGRQRALALQAGADDFLSIPFEHEELVARVSALGRRSPPRSARAGAFVVDFRRREILVNDRPVGLTPNEYDLIVALIEQVGEVVSRKELASRIDRAGTGQRSNVVDVHMSRIRRKLGASASRLEAVRGRGYRLRAH